MEGKHSSVETWTCNDVGKWLKETGFCQYAELFTTTHRIDGPALLCLSEKDLREPPLKLDVLGDIKHLALKVNELRSYCSHTLPDISEENSPLTGVGGRRKTKEKSSHNSASRSQLKSAPRQENIESDEVDSSYRDNNREEYEESQKILDIPPEVWKTVLSIIYVTLVILLTSFVMVVVHDRVPEMEKYPPLPDLFLDNMPYVPWAFETCEIVGTILSVMWITILIFHKYRFVLMRRMFSLLGTIFLLRCVTMLITSLSVPGRHLQCSGQRYDNFYSRFERAVEIWQGMGMSIRGVRTCGDYMFSGHTSVITLLNFFITEYTPKRYYSVHIVSWCLNFFGIFFILAAHEHYSIDVFVAFYLSSRLFMYYHTLANNRALMAPDARRTRAWFPLFAFFESKCEGRVPNEFELPHKQFAPLLSMILRWIVPSRGSKDPVQLPPPSNAVLSSDIPHSEAVAKGMPKKYK